MPTFDAVSEVLWSLSTLGLIGLSAFGFGRPVARKLAIHNDGPLAVAVWSIALGLLGVGSVLLLLAWAGWLHSAVVAAISAAGLLWSLVELACEYLGWANGRVLVAGSPLDCARTLEPPDPPGAKLILVPVATVIVTTLILALAPPTSPEVLSSCLDIPKNILLGHSLDESRPDARPSTNIAQMWSLWALALDGPVAANLVHWGVGLLAALAAMLLARVSMPVRAARLAGCLAVTCPGVQYQLGVPLDDLALGLFAALALTAVFRVLVNLEHATWPIAAGLALGAAIAVQSAGIVLAATVAVLWAHCRARGTAVAGEIGVTCTMGVIALVVALPWIFLAGSTLSRSEQQSIESTLAHLGPVLCLGMAALVFARRLRGLSLALGALIVYPTAIVLSSCPGRWWPALVAPAAVVVAWGWHELARLPRPAGLLASLCLVAMALAPAISQWPAAADSLAVATGRQRRSDFLLTHEPTYRAASLLNRIRRTEDRILCQDARMFYFDCQTCWQDVQSFPRSLGDRERDASQRACSDGFTYLLLAEAGNQASNSATAGSDAESPPPSDSTLSDSTPSRKFGAIGEVIPILEYRFADDNNRLIRYRLLRLAGSRNRIH